MPILYLFVDSFRSHSVPLLKDSCKQASHVPRLERESTYSNVLDGLSYSFVHTKNFTSSVQTWPN